MVKCFLKRPQMPSLVAQVCRSGDNDPRKVKGDSWALGKYGLSNCSVTLTTKQTGAIRTEKQLPVTDAVTPSLSTNHSEQMCYSKTAKPLLANLPVLTPCSVLLSYDASHT